MPTIRTDDGERTLEVPDSQFAVLEQFLTIDPRKMEALLQFADEYLAFSTATDEPTASKPTLRVIANGVLSHEIPCERRVLARIHGTHQPSCRWERNPDGGYRCKARAEDGSECGALAKPGSSACQVIADLLGEAMQPEPQLGDKGVRDPEAPCSDFDPSSRGALDFADCEGDGHYLCAECRHRKPDEPTDED